eukprot:11821963-Ditylum_brightwellii.AAC.1
MDINMEPTVEEQKDGMLMTEHLEEAIKVEEALWAEAEEKERQECYQTLMVEQKKMEEEKRRE